MYKSNASPAGLMHPQVVPPLPLLRLVLCNGRQALVSPSTGIVDSHSLMLALLGDAEQHGATLAYHAPITNTQVDRHMYTQSTHTVHTHKAHTPQPAMCSLTDCIMTQCVLEGLN